MEGLYDQIQEAVTYIRTKTTVVPKTAIILGTGWTTMEGVVRDSIAIPYGEIPHFATSTVKSHSGQLIIGHLEGKPVIMMSGRFHYYEGYSMQQVTFPVRVMHALGASQIFITNASGGTNANIETGDLLILKDHINLMGDNPLRGWNDDRLGDRFPDMMHGYDKAFRAFALQTAADYNIRIHEGVYVGFAGPNLETPAEYKFLNSIGGDAVGMSTVPEVLVAKHAAMKVAVLSIISNKCFPIEAIQETSVDDVIAAVNKSIPKAIEILRAMVGKFG
jgi:purine-nucleoside phosphorylase